MPQPFDGPCTWTPDSLSLRPQFAQHIGIIAGMWAQVEACLGLTLATMLGADAVTGVSMYNTVVAEPTRRALLLAIANENLSPEQFADFDLLLKSLKTPRKQRNTIVHGLWAVEERHDSLILIAIDEWTHSIAVPYEILSGGSTSARTQRIMERAIKSKLRYTASDFISIQKEIKESLSRVQEFQAALAIPLHQRYFATHSPGFSPQSPTPEADSPKEPPQP